VKRLFHFYGRAAFVCIAAWSGTAFADDPYPRDAGADSWQVAAYWQRRANEGREIFEWRCRAGAPPEIQSRCAVARSANIPDDIRLAEIGPRASGPYLEGLRRTDATRNRAFAWLRRREIVCGSILTGAPAPETKEGAAWCRVQRNP